MRRARRASAPGRASPGSVGDALPSRSRRSRRRPAAITPCTEAAGPRRGCTSSSCGRSCPTWSRATRSWPGCARSWRAPAALEAGDGYPARRGRGAARGRDQRGNHRRVVQRPVSRATERRHRGPSVDRPGRRRAARARHGRPARHRDGRGGRVERRSRSARRAPSTSADALRAAARRLGRTLGGRVIGLPGAGDDDLQSR